MQSKPKTVNCPFCQQPVKFPPTFCERLKCVCGAEYHYEFGDDLYLEILDAEKNKKEWRCVFVGVVDEWDEETGLMFTINYDVKEEYLLLNRDEIYLFFTRQGADA